MPPRKCFSPLVLLLVLAASLSAGSAPRRQPAGDSEPRRLRALCFRLGDNRPGKKWDAARELIAEGQAAIPVVAELFGGEWVEGKRMAAWILGQIHHPDAAGPLAKALNDADEEVRWKAAVGLTRIGRPATPFLVATLLSGNLEAKRCAAWALGEIADPQAAGGLAATLEEDDEALRWKAAISLSRIGEPALPALAEVFASDKVATRRCAVWAVGQIGGQAALPALKRALADPDNHVRAKAVVALGNIPGKAATELLLGMVDDPDPVVRKDAIVALGRRGKALDPASRPKALAEEPTTRVPLYGACEVAFAPEDPPRLADPFADATLTATFVAPDERNIRVRGFYAGEGTWKARALLDQTGLWYYRLDWKAGEASHVAHGGAKCVPSEAHGLLRIHPRRPRCFAFADGTPFYPIGAGTVALGAPGREGEPANTLAVWKDYLDACAKAGMNRCRIFLLEAPWVPKHLVRLHPQLAPWPMEAGYDLGRFALPFWDKLDAVIEHAAKAGIVVELSVFDETGLASGDGQRWALHPFNEANGGPIEGVAGCPKFYDLSIEANRAAQEAYVAYLLARTCGYANVVYELNNLMDRRGTAGRLGVRWAEHWAGFVREHDPFDHLVSLSAVHQAERYFRIQGIDVANVHGAEPPEPHGIQMPVLLSVPRARSPREERALFWRALLVGTSSARAPWYALAARTAVFEHCRHFADYVASRDIRYWELRRDDSVVLGTPGRVRAYASVREGEVLVYLVGDAEDGTVRVGLAPGTYVASWFDPKTGIVRRRQEVEPRRGAASLPCPPFDEDLVLRITRK
ncbi:MAG: HEAT repeat domain-containing protein [Candidatus Brocadiia bacterium]